ncbi:MAG: xylB [Paenibacillaceae bacterium]|nr:xylB [Paenibacillaceae bacterium]
MEYVLGIDFGGGASKATLLGADGKVAAVSTTEYPTYYPRTGYAEQDPRDWYQATCRNIAAVISESGAKPESIAAVCLDAATHTAVLMDEGCRVLRPAIYWTDTRSGDQVRRLQEHHRGLILEQAYHEPDTIWTLPQLMWVKEREPDIWSRVKRLLFAKDYVRYLLTGVYATDYIEAEGSMLFDCRNKCWSPELCGIPGLAVDLLPPVMSPMDQAGTITARAAGDTGLAPGTPVICGTTDTALEVLAAGAVRPGQMTVKLATAGRICVITDRPVTGRHLITYSHVVPGLSYPGTATKSCAASYRWYRDVFGGEYARLNDEAAAAPPGCDGLFFHPYLNGELTPYADPGLCGSFVGIRAGHTRSHFSRAVLEGVAFSLLDCLHELERMGIPYRQQAVIIGGGASSPLWRQITADVLGIALEEKSRSDSSLGGAMLAGVAAGFFPDLEAGLRASTHTVSVTRPRTALTEWYAGRFTQYKAIHDALAPIYQGDGYANSSVPQI